jgi:dienelactone hydrolase
MGGRVRACVVAGGLVAVSGAVWAQSSPPLAAAPYKTLEIRFTSHDGHGMFGKLTVPDSPGPHPVVVFVQTAEAQTVDTRVQGPKGPLDFFDLYRRELAAVGVGFFSYEGRGVQMGDQPPRYLKVDRPVYNTSTLENKVRDAITAVRVLQKQPAIDASRIVLRGHSEGTLLAAETASRMPKEIRAVALSGVLTYLPAALTFMMTDGWFWQHQAHWDANRDGVITATEFQADPRGIRKLMPPDFLFSNFDHNGDGRYTVDDVRQARKPMVDAVGAGNAEAAMPFLKGAAAVEIPDGWVVDHFRHAPIDTFLSQLQIPVGLFQGAVDQLTPASEVRALESRMKAAGKSNMEFQYFPDHDHSFGGLQYFLRGTPSSGYRALFDWVRRQTNR